MTKTISTDKIWETLRNDPKFIAEAPEYTHPVMRDLVEQLPTILAEQLDRPVTFSEVLKAKLAVIKHCVETDFIGRMLETYPAEAFGMFSKNDMLEMGRDTLKELNSMLGEICEDAIAWLDRQGVKDEQVLTNPKMPVLTGDTLAPYRAGTLTIGQLLMMNPNAFIKNTD